MLRKVSNIRGIEKQRWVMMLIAYADDVTLLVNDKKDIDEAIRLVERFCQGTQFALNSDKTEHFDPSQTCEDQTITLLGVHLFNNEERERNFHQQLLIKGSEKAKKTCRTSMSMKTKSCVIKAFVMQNVVFHAKATNIDRMTWGKIRRNLKQVLHSNRNNQVSERLLFQAPRDGGVCFPCMKTYMEPSFSLDVWRAVVFNDDNFTALKIKNAVPVEQSHIHKKLKQMRIITKSQTITFRRDHIEFETTEGKKIPATSKALYAFAIRRQHENFANERIMKACSKLETAPIQLLRN